MKRGVEDDVLGLAHDEAVEDAVGELVDVYRRYVDRAKQSEETAAAVAAMLLRHRGVSDRRIAQTLGISRNRVTDLIAGQRLDVPELAADSPMAKTWSAARDHYGLNWTRAASGFARLSGEIIEQFRIPILYPVLTPAHLDVPGRVYARTVAGSGGILVDAHIVVYSQERWDGGAPGPDDGPEDLGTGRGIYQIEVIDGETGVREPIPLSVLELKPADIRFGPGWPGTSRRPARDGDALARITTAIERCYGVVPDLDEIRTFVWAPD